MTMILLTGRHKTTRVCYVYTNFDDIKGFYVVAGHIDVIHRNRMTHDR